MVYSVDSKKFKGYVINRIMAYKTLSGKEPAEEVLKEIEQRIKKLKHKPMLAIVVVGEYKPSQIYVKRKMETAAKIGIETEIHRLVDNISEKELVQLVEKLNNDKKIDGFIIQTPLPKHINAQHVFEKIAPEKDVDGFHPKNMGKVLLNIFNDNMFSPATPTGIMQLLQYYKAPLEGANACVIGRSNVVGKPIAIMLLHHNATVSICHSHTKNLASYTKNADVLIVAAGSPGLVKADMVKEGAFVVDVGTTRIRVGNENKDDKNGKDKVVGDVDFENVIKKAHCSPVPGGVGPMTVAMLLYNTVKAAEINERIK